MASSAGRATTWLLINFRDLSLGPDGLDELPPVARPFRSARLTLQLASKVPTTRVCGCQKPTVQTKCSIGMVRFDYSNRRGTARSANAPGDPRGACPSREPVSVTAWCGRPILKRMLRPAMRR
jgi:hypothetical protein